MKMNIRNSKTKGGFTLVEILIVLVVVALLAAMSLSNFGSTPARGKATTDRGSLVTLQQNVDTFVAQYGVIPSDWGSGGTTMTEAQRVLLLQAISGQYTANTVAGLATYSQNNPTHTLRFAAADAAKKFTAVIVPSTANPRVVILQHRNESTGLIYNGDHSVSNTFIPDATAMTPPLLFDATTNTAWTSAGKAAYPF